MSKPLVVYVLWCTNGNNGTIQSSMNVVIMQASKPV